MNNMLRTVWFIIILFLPSGFRFRNTHSVRDVNYGKYSIRIDDESRILITGRTNISTFTFRYKENLTRDTLHIITLSEGNHTLIRNAQLKLNAASFKGNNRAMDSDFLELLQADKYPFITIRLLDINRNLSDYKSYYVNSISQKSLNLNVEITLAGSKNTYDLPVEILKNGGSFLYKGNIRLNIRDFGLDPPKKMFGLIVVNKMIDIDFLIKINPV